MSKRNAGGLRRRWLMNSVAVVSALGLACVFAVTSVFAAYYYSNMESDLRSRADNTMKYFARIFSQDEKEFYQSCTNYATSFDDRDKLELQFVRTDGEIAASSYGGWVAQSPKTPEIQKAISIRGNASYKGRDPDTGERIMAVSRPMIYSNGEVIGVLRFVTSTRMVDLQIAIIFLLSMAMYLVVVLVVLASSNYYIRSILVPVAEIVEKARRIAEGGYGVQIQTKYDDEIGDLAETINEMSTKISQNEKMQAEFISSLSHELRTPLTAITGWSETLLSSDDLDADARRGMQIIHREAKRLTEMVVELLDFTRLQDGRLTLNVEPSDLRGEFEDTVYMYGSRLRQEGITLHYEDSDTDFPEVNCDAKRMRQVFLNILDNAAKHGGEGKRIDASIEYTGTAVVVKIRDYGPGIPEDELPLVKKKFFKGSSKARGSGIGLAVCDEIVELHGGTLTLENAVGGGTVVTVMLPTAL